jgi:hypothetical protein
MYFKVIENRMPSFFEKGTHYEKFFLRRRDFYRNLFVFEFINKDSTVVVAYRQDGKHCHAYMTAKKNKKYKPRRDLCIHCTPGKNDTYKTEWAVQHFHKVLGR